MENIGNITGDMLYKSFDDFVNGKKKGVIELPVPVANITEWYGDRSLWAIATGLSLDDMERVIYYAGWLVIDPKDTGLAKGAVLSEEELAGAVNKYGEGSFAAGIGAEAVNAFLDGIDLPGLYEQGREEERFCMRELKAIEDAAKDESGNTEELEEKETKLNAKLDDVRARIDAYLYLMKNRDRFLIRSIRVLPVQIRAMAREVAERTPYGVFHDLDVLYFSIAIRAERLQKLNDLKAPDVILQNEKRMLQKNVDNLLANGLREKPKTKGDSDVPLLCLRDVMMRAVDLC